MIPDVTVSREVESVRMVGVSAALEDLLVVPGDVLMAVTIVWHRSK